MKRWLTLLLRFYPADFRDQFGAALVETYCARARASSARGWLAMVWVGVSAFVHSLRHGVGERLRRPAGGRRSGGWGRDLQMARRRLMRSPLFVAATVATLTVGLGAFAVVYTAVYKVVIEPMPYRDSGNLYWVWRDQSAFGGLSRDWLTGPDVAELQRARETIDGAVGTQTAVPTFSLTPDGEPHQILMLLTSPNLFELLGVSPMLGRAFAPDEVGPNRPSVVILSHAFWTRLGADSGIVGSDVWMSGTRYTVIGVMGPSFRFVRHSVQRQPAEPDVYLTFRFHVADQDPKATSFAGLIRVRDGVSPEQAGAAVGAVGRVVDERDNQRRGMKLYPVGLQADLVAPVRPILLGLGAAGVFLVLVLAVNLASLLLARATEREREFAVSRAVGANGGALVRAMVFEGAALGFLGGVAGAVAGTWGARILVALAPIDLPRRDAIVLDWTVAAVVVAVGTALGIAAAVIPAAWAARVSLSSLLAASAVRGAGGSTRMRRAMVVTQIALSLVLLNAGGLVGRSFSRLLAANPGFTSDGILTFTVAMGPRLFPKPEAAVAFQDRLESALAGVPGITAVSATTALPLSAGGAQTTITIPGAPGMTGDAARDNVMVDVVFTRARYAELMGVRMLDGRPFEEARRGNVREALIDRHLARQFFPTGSPIGATIPVSLRFGPPDIPFDRSALTIVGVIDQPRLYDLHADGRPQILVRAEDWTPYTPSFVVRTDRDPRALIPEVGRVVRQVDPRIPVSSVQTMDEIVTNALRQPRISTVLIAGFALGALLLAAMGLFGMIAGAIVRRRGELAVRLALGATHQRVLRLVVGEGGLLVALGMAFAIPGIYAGGRLIRGLLIDISPWDPLTLVAVAVGLALVAVTACYVPARRVLAIDPAPLLRQD